MKGEMRSMENTSIEKTPQEFITAYETLCKEYGYNIVASLAYIKRDDNTYSTVIQMSVGKLPKEE
jgi:hypothetical protein